MVDILIMIFGCLVLSLRTQWIYATGDAAWVWEVCNRHRAVSAHDPVPPASENSRKIFHALEAVIDFRPCCPERADVYNLLR